MMEVSLCKIQADKTLEPLMNHPAHELYEGMLLHGSADTITRNEDGEQVARLC